MAVYRRSARPRFLLLLLVLTAITLVTIDTRANGGGLTGGIRSQAHDLFAVTTARIAPSSKSSFASYSP